jgi:hypothetical protein
MEIHQMSHSSCEHQSEVAWCTVCGTDHADPALCPGPLNLNGQGEKVWQSKFRTTGGESTFLVTRTERGTRWCARIFTHPNIPWSIPGGGTAIKFLSDDPEECKNDAIVFLNGFCRRKGYVNADNTNEQEKEQDRPIRLESSIPLIWGTGSPSTPGASLNVSASGMFVATEVPPEPGTTIRIRLKMGALSLPLRGRVTWRRDAPDPVRKLEAGMGVCLLSPPGIYKGYIRQLA